DCADAIAGLKAGARSRRFLLDRNRARRDRGPRDVKRTDALYVAEAVALVARNRRGGEADLRAVAIDVEREVVPGVDRDCALHFVPTLDRLAVDRNDDVTRFESGGGCRSAGADAVDAWRDHLLAEDQHERRKDQDGEDEIRNRSRGHDGGASKD